GRPRGSGSASISWTSDSDCCSGGRHASSEEHRNSEGGCRAKRLGSTANPMTHCASAPRSSSRTAARRDVPRPASDRRRVPRHVPLGLALALVLPGCIGVRARAYAGMTHAVLQGDLALDNSSGNLPLGANRVDLDRELGAEDPSVAPYVRAEVGLPIGAVTLSGFTYSETGSGTLAPNHQYGDIPGGSQVSTFLSFTNVKAAAHFDLFDFGIVRVSPGLGVDYFE